MPASVVASGAQTATPGTTHTLATVTVPAGGANYILKVDRSNMQLGDGLTLRARSRARPGDPLLDMYPPALFANAPSTGGGLELSPLIPADGGNTVEVTLRQDGGTGRVYPWALLRIDA